MNQLLRRRWWTTKPQPFALDRNEWLRLLRRETIVDAGTAGVGSLVMGLGLWLGGAQAFGHFPVLWLVPMFIGSGLLMLGWCLHPQSSLLAITSGLAGIASLMIRLVATLLYYQFNDIPISVPAFVLLLATSVPPMRYVYSIWRIRVVPIAKGLRDKTTWAT